MPIWLRKLTYKKIEKFYGDENERVEKQNNILSSNNLPQVQSPPKVLSNNQYTSKISKN